MNRHLSDGSPRAFCVAIDLNTHGRAVRSGTALSSLSLPVESVPGWQHLAGVKLLNYWGMRFAASISLRKDIFGLFRHICTSGQSPTIDFRLDAQARFVQHSAGAH
jgi:hypothetical protein